METAMPDPGRKLGRIRRTIVHKPAEALRKAYWFWRGLSQSPNIRFSAAPSRESGVESNPLRKYFDSVDRGPGIWKWNHYFDIYHRHFARFRGKDVNIVEIGVYSGGSLTMWRDYFGPRCRVFGVDIEEQCRNYESDGIEIFIGDQADRAFWKDFKARAPRIDIVVDDGGHQVDQQVATLEELLPHLQPGGVYLCEDITGKFNDFWMYIFGLAQNLNRVQLEDNSDNHERRLVAKASAFQSAIESIHVYPFVTVIEKRAFDVAEFVAPKHGTEWEPFLQ